jgi:hypothetical protein
MHGLHCCNEIGLGLAEMAVSHQPVYRNGPKNVGLLSAMRSTDIFLQPSLLCNPLPPTLVHWHALQITYASKPEDPWRSIHDPDNPDLLKAFSPAQISFIEAALAVMAFHPRNRRALNIRVF